MAGTYIFYSPSRTMYEYYTHSADEEELGAQIGLHYFPKIHYKYLTDLRL